MADYSQYVAIKKASVAQTANANTAIAKRRVSYRNDGYFPLYRGVKLPPNALTSNKFIVSTPRVTGPTSLVSSIINVLSSQVDPNYPLLGEPTKAAFDGNDTIYITSYYTTTAGNSIIAYSISSGTRSIFTTKAQTVQSPYTIAYDSARSCIYLGSLGNSIVKVSVPDKTVTTLTNILNNYGVAYDGSLYLYATITNQAIYQINVVTGTSTLFAGAPGVSGSQDGSRLSARFNIPTGIVYDGTDNLYISDTNNRTIRKLSISSGIVTTIAGSVGQAGSADGIGSAARFTGINDLSYDSSKGKLYMIDEQLHTVRSLDIIDNSVTTVAGISGQSGNIIGPNNNALASTFSSPRGLIFVSPYVYVMDTRNNSLKRLTITYTS